MDERASRTTLAQHRHQVWLRRWEWTFRLAVLPVLLAVIAPFKLPDPAIAAAMMALGVLTVLAQPGHWTRRYSPPESERPFFARELTTGDHYLSLFLWTLAVAVLVAWPAIASHAPRPVEQLIHGLLFLGFGVLLAKCVFPGQSAGLFARAGDERYASNQAIAHGLALRAGCAAVLVLLLIDLLVPAILSPPFLIGMALCARQATYHGAMWRMEHRGEPSDE